MEMFSAGMSQSDTCVVLVHVKGDIPHVVIDDLLQDARSLCYIYHSIVPFGE
jgi:hypothetical protein